MKYQDKYFRQRKKEYGKERYHKKPELKEKVMQSKKRRRNINASKCVDTDYVLENFQKKASEGACYACSSCHRLLFKNQVEKCDLESFKEKSESIWNVARQCISDKYIHTCSAQCPLNCTFSSHWICKTCQRKIMSSQIPAECAANNMQLFDVLVELENLNTLEKYFNDIYNRAPAEGKIQYECFKKMEMKQSLFHIYSQMGRTHGQRVEKRGLHLQSTLTTD